ncbi:glycosyltransferase family 4 protein [Maribacter chungangensis]|uniref:Glycosyltransferase family 4 protein n=1 Tax=Maribacter chungangensis TaxID=1069117 RepID=A0ABW3B559_9FLAO
MSNPKPRIFMVNQGDDSQRFGVGRYISEMVGEAKNRKRILEMVLITIGVNDISKVEIKKDGNITHFNVPKPFLVGQGLMYGISKQLSSGVFLLLTDYFTFNSSDIFHFNSNMQHFLLHKIKQNTTVRIVYTVHVSMWNVLYNNDEEKFLSEWNDRECFSLSKKNILAEIENCKLADLIIGLSNNTVEDLRKYYKVPKNKLKRIFNGISTEPPEIDEKKLKNIRKQVGLHTTDFIFLFAGRINEQKGISDLVEAFIRLTNGGHGNIKLIVVGDGPLKKTLEDKTKGDYPFIKYIGYVPQNEIQYYYKLSDTIVIPSLYDQNPYSILEAMAYKVPMILTDIDAFLKLQNGLVCLKVPLKNEYKVAVAQLKKQMQHIIEKPELRIQLIENAHRMLVSNFSAAQMFNKTYTV